ncbi:GlsB/YeaQ/YmgE family stress response membrane protein [Celeribacter sp.]|uniref:GlsB/YeaQ/YmgE family stress response membrane protein n=1 Tax=Celeribacter sp. TaxID=1890673 RepID=UPI003A94990C
MPILFLVIVGAAAGFIATRLLDLRSSVPVSIAIGIAGALFGTLILRLIGALFGMAAGFVGAILGAMALIWIWKKISERG